MISNNIEIKINSEKIIKVVFFSLVSIDLGLALCDIFLNHLQWTSIGPLRRFFNIAREDSLANWYASSQLLLTGFILLIIFSFEKASKSPKNSLFGWGLMAGFFIYMGIDEATKLHERLGSSFKIFAEQNETLGQMLSAFPSYPWQLILVPFFAAMGLFIVWFLYRKLNTWQLKANIVLALAFYVLAVGLDFVEGMQSDPYTALAAYLNLSTESIRHFSKVIEETIELLGTTFFLLTFLKFLCAQEKDIHIYLRKQSP